MCLYFHQDRNARWILGTMYGDEWKEICPYCVNSDFMPFALTWMVTKMGECPESCSWNCETMDDHRHSGTIRQMQHSRHLVPNLGWQSTKIIHTEMLPVNPMTMRVSWHIGRRWIRSEKNTSMYLFMVLIPFVGDRNRWVDHWVRRVFAGDWSEKWLSFWTSLIRCQGFQWRSIQVSLL